MSSPATGISPYVEAWEWIERHTGTPVGRGFVKLLLSLFNRTNAFSFSECIDDLDEEGTELALRVVMHFATFGVDRELAEIGMRATVTYPQLAQLGRVACDAQRALLAKWLEQEKAPQNAVPPATRTRRLDLVPKPRESVELTVVVPADREEAFTRMWHEVVSGRSPQDQAIRDRAKSRNQSVASLRELVRVAQGNSGQCRYIARFLAGCYNGPRFPFDLTDLRPIDDELFEHALAVLRMDHAPEKEVHNYFVDGSKLWEEDIIGRWDLDKHSALEAASLLSAYLESAAESAPENATSAELRQLGSCIEKWRRSSEQES